MVKIPRNINPAEILKNLEEHASTVAANSGLLRELVARAENYQQKQAGRIHTVLTDLKTMLRLIQAYSKGTYREVPWGTLLAIVGAIIYFVNPLDVIPDVIAGAGLVDDAMVISFVASKIHNSLEKFRTVEAGPDVTPEPQL
jgi:uncharacterized membrane protein YkvA (DUF1232 family)